MAAVPSIGADMTRDLYERYGRQIFAYCLHQLGSREEAEDATQTTFMNAFRGLQRGVVPELESAWLYKIANNVVLTRRRSSYRRRRVETPGDLDALQDLLPSPQRDADELVHLRGALEAMPEQQRRALLLREWQGLSYREIADELGLTQGAVETLLFRARRSLAAGLTESPEAKRTGLRRLRSGLDLSSVLAAAKALLSGGAAVKVAVTAAAVATTAVGGVEVARHQVKPEPQAPHVAPPVPRRTIATTVVSAPVRRVVPTVQHRVVQHAAPPPVRHAAVAPVPVVADQPVATPTPVAVTPEPVVVTTAPVETTPTPVESTPQPKENGRGHSEQAAKDTVAAPVVVDDQRGRSEEHRRDAAAHEQAAPTDPTTSTPTETTPAPEPTPPPAADDQHGNGRGPRDR